MRNYMLEHFSWSGAVASWSYRSDSIIAQICGWFTIWDLSLPLLWGVCCVCRLCRGGTGSGRSWQHTTAVSPSPLCSRSWTGPGCHCYCLLQQHHQPQTHFRSPQAPVLPFGLHTPGWAPDPDSGSYSGSDRGHRHPLQQSLSPHSQARLPLVRTAGGGPRVQVRPHPIQIPPLQSQTRHLYGCGPGRCRGGLSGC